MTKVLTPGPLDTLAPASALLAATALVLIIVLATSIPTARVVAGATTPRRFGRRVEAAGDHGSLGSPRGTAPDR